MKPFLGIDLTTDNKIKRLNGSEFLVQEPSVALSHALEVSIEDTDATIEKAKIHPLFRIVQFICGIATLFISSSILGADVSLTEIYKNAPLLFWTIPTCAVIWFVLWTWSIRKSKTVLETNESMQKFSNLDNTACAVYEELSVPDSAKDVDILLFFYKIKDETIKIQQKGMQIAQFFNPEFKVFSDTRNLYLTNLKGKYAFPLNSIIGFRTIKKHISIMSWNKEEAFDKGIYKQYKLSLDNYGCLHCKYYHILEINYQDEIYGLYIPCYELPVFKELVGLKELTK